MSVLYLAIINIKSLEMLTFLEIFTLSLQIWNTEIWLAVFFCTFVFSSMIDSIEELGAKMKHL